MCFGGSCSIDILVHIVIHAFVHSYLKNALYRDRHWLHPLQMLKPQICLNSLKLKTTIILYCGWFLSLATSYVCIKGLRNKTNVYNAWWQYNLTISPLQSLILLLIRTNMGNWVHWLYSALISPIQLLIACIHSSTPMHVGSPIYPKAREQNCSFACS